MRFFIYNLPVDWILTVLVLGCTNNDDSRFKIPRVVGRYQLKIPELFCTLKSTCIKRRT